MARRVPLPLTPPLVRYGLVGLVAGGILLASVVDPPSTGPTPLGPLGLLPLDKWLHALGYGGLTGALAYAMVPRTVPGDGRPERTVLAGLAVAVAVAAGYGFGIELVQGMLPARSFDVADAAANGTGALLAAGGWRLVAARLRPVSFW
ncbi:VanZ family protein [Halomarina litorea]|uniref:VanZ family protein n=1 Tax=Halomarina litorea TaxID=2961595 RepID=UPI0020C20B44|nr:VanZ family protein [Halomarina sp. BCD28]